MTRAELDLIIEYVNVKCRIVAASMQADLALTRSSSDRAIEIIGELEELIPEDDS